MSEINISIKFIEISNDDRYDIDIYDSVDSNGEKCVMISFDGKLTPDYDLNLSGKIDLKYILSKVVSRIACNYQALREVKGWENYNAGVSLKDLKEFIEKNKDLPDDTPIFVERIQDHYFLNHHWATLRVKSHEAHEHEDFQSEYFRVWWPTVETDLEGRKVIALDCHY